MRANISIPTSRGSDIITAADYMYNKYGHIYLTGKIDEEKAEEVNLQLIARDAMYPGLPIWIINQGPGGIIDPGFSIIDTMNAIRSPVYTVAVGLVASMNGIIGAAGEKGHRYALPHARIMIHEPLIPGGAGGSATSIQRISESILLTKKTINELLAECTGRSIEEIDKATSFDNYMSVDQAIEFGICDKVISDLSILYNKESE